MKLTTAATVALMFGDAADLRRRSSPGVSGSSACASATGARDGDLFLRRRARRGRRIERGSRAISAGPARPRRLGDLGRLLGRDGAAHAALLALPDQRVHGLVGSVPLILTAIIQIGEQDWDALAGSPGRASRLRLLFSLVFTNIMWFTAIDKVGAARASLYANLQPFLGAFFALVAPLGGDGALCRSSAGS